jgi:hypothetical protein
MKKSRNSNIEMLRILSMISIIMGHFVTQSAFSEYALTVNSYVIILISSASRISTNIFLIIGIWFMLEQKFKAERVLKMYGQMFLISAGFTTFMLILNIDVSLKDILRGYLPFFGIAFWFASAYITLYLFAPFLNKVFLLCKKQQKLLIGLSLITVCMISTMPDAQMGYLVDSLWFLFMYVWIGFFKKNLYEKLQKKKIFLLVGAGIYFILVNMKFFGCIYQNEGIAYRGLYILSNQYLLDIKTLPNVLCAFFIFLYFIMKTEKNNEFMNRIGSYSFCAYLVHQVPAFYNFLWKNIYKSDSFKNMQFSVVYVIAVAVTVYLAASAVEIVRVRWLEPVYVKTYFFRTMEDKIDSIYKEF